MTRTVTLTSDALEIRIATLGAELTSVRDDQGREWLWQGDPASWPRQAPVLFPVVGQVPAGVVRHRGQTYPMTTHGFAPVSDFAVAEETPERCVLRCVADARTRKAYPFEFELDITFALSGSVLTQRATVTNRGAEDMPSSVGFHPGFQWPLPSSPEAPREAHVIAFARAEPHPIRRIAGSGLGPAIHQNPSRDRVIALKDDLFAPSAMVFDRLESRALWFGVPGANGIVVDLGDMPHLGIWTRPPAPYLCIEPWQGFSDPDGFSGELSDKPGMVILAPGESYSRTIGMAFDRPAPIGDGGF